MTLHRRDCISIHLVTACVAALAGDEWRLFFLAMLMIEDERPVSCLVPPVFSDAGCSLSFFSGVYSFSVCFVPKCGLVAMFGQERKAWLVAASPPI